MSQDKMLSNVDLIEGFVKTTNESAASSFSYIVNNRRNIVKAFGANTLHEMILNHRTYYKRNKKQQIAQAYQKYVMSKKKHHTSDFVIGRNILTFLWLDPHTEQMIVNFLFDELQPRMQCSTLARFPKMRKKLVLEYIEQHMMRRK